VTLSTGTSIKVREEIILSAGTIQSPGLLELSGIGQAAVLSAAKIPQLVELHGVGENLQDHIRVQASYQLNDSFRSFDILRANATVASQELNKWLARNLSLYDYTASAYLFGNWEQILGITKNGSVSTSSSSASSLSNSNLLSMATSSITHPPSPIDAMKLAFLADPRVPQVEVIFSDGYTGTKGYPAQGTPLFGKGFFTLIAALMHPFARGSIHIDPSNPGGDKPIIDPHYLNNEFDRRALVEAAKLVRRLAESQPLRSVWVSEYEPGIDTVPQNATDDQWLAYAKKAVSTVYHPTGTCAMMPRKLGGVVDHNLRVYGTTNLRVADASIIPVQISAHIQTAVYGIAERAADIILDEARK
jgi:choline dehydrogenase-like flavoprotein